MGNVIKASCGTLGVVGDEMVGSSSDVKRGDLRKVGLGNRPAEVRGGVVVKKPSNAGGAKARQEGGCVESMTKQAELPKVGETPKQGREAECQKWGWVEAEVWTRAHADDPGDRSERRAMV